MRLLLFNNPSVVCINPGINDNPVINVFGCEEDVNTFLKADDEVNCYGPDDGYRNVCMDGIINIESLERENICVHYWTHEELQKYLKNLHTYTICAVMGDKEDWDWRIVNAKPTLQHAILWTHNNYGIGSGYAIFKDNIRILPNE